MCNSIPGNGRLPVADAYGLRCLKPRNLLRHGLPYHFLYFHGPLHRGGFGGRNYDGVVFEITP
jgi:hypothetical protein